MMTSRKTYAAWGKRDKHDGMIHLLVNHCMDVAAVFARLMELPVIRSRLETTADVTLTDTLCQRLSALVFLHDIGKLHPGFQAKGWASELYNKNRRGHSKEGWEFLKLAWKYSDHPFHMTMQLVERWGDATGPLLAAVFAHHGRRVEHPNGPMLKDWDSPSLEHYDWQGEARNIDMALRRWFTQAFEYVDEPLPESPQFHHEVAGLITLADWIGSDTRFFPFDATYDLGYNSIAHSAAKEALEAIHLDLAHVTEQAVPSFAKLTNHPTPNPAQAVLGSVGTESQLVILEAETGSGKTEAALWRFVQLFIAGKVSSLYFAVPTRAAARQLHSRVVKAISRAFGPDLADSVVLAIPGMLKAGDSIGKRLPEWAVLWDDDSKSTHRRWAAESATRFLASFIAVGTVDQAMLAGLQVKHAHLRGSVLSRSLLVIDEVHASDTYMSEILKQLLDGHLATGGYAMLMSATLSARARVHWTGEMLPEFTAACSTPYPAVWVKNEKSPRVADARRSKLVQIEAVPTMDPVETANRAITIAKKDARVLLIRNTVTKAVETWHAIKEAGEGSLLMQVGQGPALHHGRFAAEDRTALDLEVEAMLTKDTARERRGCIVIGTQTLEQSLDIDADFLITDLCPMDVLLQRIGRLHRHNLPRPKGFETARAIVLMPENGLDHLAEPNFENGLGGWMEADGWFNGIYRDIVGLELTRRSIEEDPLWRIPDMNRDLVEGTTHYDCLTKLIKEKGNTWDSYYQLHGGTEAAAKMVAKLNCLDREEPFDNVQFPRDDESIMTHLGEEGTILPLDPPPVGPFGNRLTLIALPARWSRGIKKDAKIVAEPDQNGLIISVGEKRFRYSRVGLERIST